MNKYINNKIKHISGEHLQKFIRILLCSTAKMIADDLKFEFHIQRSCKLKLSSAGM